MFWIRYDDLTSNNKVEVDKKYDINNKRIGGYFNTILLYAVVPNAPFLQLILQLTMSTTFSSAPASTRMP